MNQATDITPPPTEATSRWYRLLQQAGSPIRRRLLLVSAIGLAVWLYATTWDIVMMLFNAAADGHVSSVSQVVQLVLTRILLLPLLIGAYFVAVTLFSARRLTVWLVLVQAAIASTFSLLTSPTLAITFYLTNRTFAASHTLQDAFDLAGPWQIWLAKTVQYSIVYLLGLVLILAANAFLRYKSEQLKAEQLRSKWLEAKLGTLRGQLNPHFFFNSLNIIAALISTDPSRAEYLLTELSGLLRQSLAESDHEFTTVRNEAHFIERYLSVMKARYEDRLQIELEIAPDTLDYPMPAFLLVPLVENAIKHGVAQIPGGGSLTINGKRSGKLLHFTIRNCSTEQQTLPDVVSGAGVGIRNTYQRLSAIYGEDCRFESKRESRSTWLASVALPIAPATLAVDQDIV